jgi:DNA-binding winged helix-turn-helix (wHTH) protein
MCHEPG